MRGSSNTSEPIPQKWSRMTKKYNCYHGLGRGHVARRRVTRTSNQTTVLHVRDLSLSCTGLNPSRLVISSADKACSCSNIHPSSNYPLPPQYFCSLSSRYYQTPQRFWINATASAHISILASSNFFHTKVTPRKEKITGGSPVLSKKLL